MNAVVEKSPDASKVLNTMSGKPSPCSEATCQPCHRVDLQLLIVTPSIVPKVHQGALANARYVWHPTFDQEFTAVPRKATIPVARLARPGYVYVYYESRNCWDVWQVMTKSLTRQIVYQANTAPCSKRLSDYINKDAIKSCSQGGKNLSGHTICIEGAHAIEKVWLAYSPEIWPYKVLKRYADNPTVKVPLGNGKNIEKNLRDTIGRVLPLKEIISGNSTAPGCLKLQKGVLSQFVADFVDRSDASYLAAFSQVVNPIDVDRIGQADAFVERVRAIEKAGGSQKTPNLYHEKSMIVMLADDIGVAEDHNQLRLLAKEALKEWIRGAPNHKGEGDDPLRAWKLRSALHQEMIEEWIFAQNVAYWKRISDLGGTVGKVQRTITTNEYKTIKRYEEETGKQHDAPGTKYVQVSDNWVRVIPPQPVLDKTIAEKANERSQEKIKRYRGKVRFDQLTAFRQEFQKGKTAWEEHIAALDADFVCWLKQPRLAVTMQYDHNGELNFVKPEDGDGTPAEQVNAWMARVRSTGKVWGGGAITDVSARELAKAYDKDPDAPATWIDTALLAPFDVVDNIVKEPGKRKDFVEKVNGLLREIPEKVEEVIHGFHELHKEHLGALVEANHQAAQIHAALVDKDRAKQLGRAVVAEKEAERILKLQVRTAAVVDLMTNPVAERYVTIAVKVPTGEALDRVAVEFQGGQLEMDIETKTETTRKTRRTNANKLRKLAGRPGLDKPEFQPVMLTQKRLAELERQAVKQGEEMVEVIAEDALGHHLPAGFKLPKSTALNLIGEQASSALAARKAILSRGSGVVAVIAWFQGYALWKSLKKLDETEGVDHADTLMTVFTSTTGLLEGATAVTSGYFAIKAAGNKVMLSSVVTRAAIVRLAGGIAGAAGSAFDAYAAYAKYCSAKERGSSEAMKAYGVSAGLFTASGIGLGIGAGLTFAVSTTARFAISEAAVVAVGGAVATEMVIATLTGVGIVLAIAGFAYAIYAESLEDDLNDIFLKRSYWGAGRAPAEPFGSSARPAIAVGNDRGNKDVTPGGKANADEFLKWAAAGIQQEVSGLSALSIGLKCSLEWADKEWLVAKLEVPDGKKQRLNYALSIQGTDGKPLLVDRGSNVEFEFEAEEQRYVLKKKLTTVVYWEQVAWGSFDYNVYEEEGKALVAHDTIQVKKPE